MLSLAAVELDVVELVEVVLVVVLEVELEVVLALVLVVVVLVVVGTKLMEPSSVATVGSMS